ncbi:MAG: PA14 domain-containing protein [Kiritimatiellae bacterium]|jgi:fibronectin-binding autotransporter adhesin|nr:PA14 domain-containing protein [Kiritimatiellia bacterium]
MNRKWSVVLGLLCSALFAHAQIETNGALLLNIDASSLSALTDGSKVNSWTNTGTLGGEFVPAVVGEGALYQASVGGTPAVTFAASADSVMTSAITPPDSILSNKIWSVELWVLNPTLQSPEDQLVWTDRGSWIGVANGQCMEFRYCADANNAVEHYSTPNIPWSGSPPLAGIWHHIAVTRDTNGTERLYADGVLRTTKTVVLNLRGGSTFKLGGVRDIGANNWKMLFSGAIAKARVHDGTLSEAQVIENYQFERDAYQTTWNGTPAVSLPWNDPANWLGGNVGADGGTVWIDNGGTAVVTNDIALAYLYADNGGLIISNGAAASVSLPMNSNMGSGVGNDFNLSIADGSFAVKGASTANLYTGVNGGQADVVIGGVGAPSLLSVDRDLISASGNGSVGNYTVLSGGAVFCSNGWFYAAMGLGAQGDVLVDGGTIGFYLADKSFVVNANGARADVVVEDGIIDATADIKWSVGTVTNAAYGAVYLNGGTLRAKRLYAETTAGTNLLYMNGGIIQARDSRANFFENLTAAYLQVGGVSFDIPTDVAVTANQSLTEDSASAGGNLTKTGAGRLTLNGINTLTGDIDVLSGDLFFSNTNGLPAAYAGAISVVNEGSIGYTKVGGPAQLLDNLNVASAGYLTLFKNNSTDAVDFSLFPSMKLAFNNVTNYTGTFTPYQGQYDYLVEGSMVGNDAVLTDDGATPGHLTITGVASGGMTLGGNNTFTGGSEIDGATVSLANANGLGSIGTPGIPDVELRNGAVLRFDAAMDVNTFVTTRLTAASSGILLIGAANAAQDVDVSGLPGIVLGSSELSLDYSGTITPSGTSYRLGGGSTAYATPNRGLSISNLTDNGSATAVVIGTPGIVELKPGNTYSGGTVVTNGGILFIKEDGLGAIPGSPDPANLYFDGGVIRSGQADFTLDANRGLAVGPNGMVVHPWGGSNMTLAGNLSGSGDITTTDSGFVTFAGTANTYAGTLTVNAGRNIRIGDGPNFNWNTTGITDNGALWLKTDGSSTFSAAVTGSGALHKEGVGTLTIDALQNYTGTTFVDAGVLQVSDLDIITSSSVIEIAAGAQLDVDGLELIVGTLQGEGDVTDSAGTATSFTVGANNASGVFDGTVESSLTLVKVGSGKQSLTASNSVAMADVQQGTLELLNSTSITGAVSVADNAILSVASGYSGLIGEFYQLASAPQSADFVSLAAVNAFLSGKTPDLVVNSTDLGTSLNMGHTKGTPVNQFPEGFDAYEDSNFVVYYSGLFFAGTAGTYGFATVSDDGSMVFIDGDVAVDNNGNQSYTLADTNAVGEVLLSKGYHEIVIAMYEAAGDQGLSVYLTPPNGTQALLPNALLFSAESVGQESSVGSIIGVAGSTLLFGSAGENTLRITDDGDMTFDGDILSDNDSSRLVKDGLGQLTLTSGTSDQSGVLDIQAGSLYLPGGAAILGTLEMASGVITEVTGLNGLVMEFYNRSVADAVYSEMQSLDAWEAYLSSTFPDGPSYVTNSLMLGANLDTASNGVNWPTDYVQTIGSENDTYDAFLHGSIYLDRSGAYTFSTGSDDGSMLYIDRTLVVTNGYDQGVTIRSGTIELNAGLHAIAIPYRENTGGNALQVYITYPGETRVMMPQSILFGGAVLRGLAGDAGSMLNLGSDGVVVLEQNSDTVHAGTIAGDTSAFVQKAGTGTLTLTDDNAGFSGGYGITAGTLRVGDAGATGALGATAYAAVGADGTLAFDRAGTVTVGGPLSGTGLIQVNGPGEVYLAANGSFEGQVEVNNGRLTYAPGISLGVDATITNSTVVEAETSDTTSFFDTLSGDGSFEVTGTGTLRLVNDNTTFEGETRIDTGATLLLSEPYQLGGGGDVVLDGGMLAVTPAVVQGTNELIPALTNTEWTANGTATWVTRSGSQWVELTPDLTSKAGSVFNNTKINPALPWYASFRYEVGSVHVDGPADGMAFVLQNDTRGLASLGATGGDIGVVGITPSIGFYFNIYNADSIGWVVDGAKVDNDTAISGIDLVSGVDIELYYDGEKLVLIVTQGANVYTDERVIDLGAKFGGNTTWAGMTAGTGGKTAQQFVGEFAMTEAEAASSDFGNTLVVEDSLSGSLAPMLLSDGTVVSFAGMDLGAAATLNVAAASGSKADTDYLVSVSNLTVTAGTATVNMATNGTGTGVLGLENLAIGSGALLTVTGGVSAPSGSLTVAVSTPVPHGITLLGDFTGATWVGAAPDLYLVDLNSDPVDEQLVLRNGKLYINTLVGSLLILR